MRSEPPLSGRFKFSFLSGVSLLLCVFPFFLTPRLASKTEFSFCVRTFLFFHPMKVVQRVLERMGVAVTAGLFPLSLYCWCSLLQPFGDFYLASGLIPHYPVRSYQQFDPSRMPLMLPKNIVLTLDADMTVHSQCATGVIVILRTKKPIITTKKIICILELAAIRNL